MRRVNEDINNQKFSNLYLLYGPEVYLKHQFRDKLIAALVNEGDTMNFSKFEGNKINDGEIIDLAETMPFFAKPVGPDADQYRVILLEECGLGRRASSAKAKDDGNLLDYFSNIPSHVIFIVVETDVDGRGKLSKAAKAAGRDIEMKMLNENDLAKWIGAKLKAEGKLMKQDAFALFLKMTHESMLNMETELEKLVSYIGEREQITAEDVEAICVSGIDSEVFDIINAISDKDLKRALDIYQELLTINVSPREIFGKLITQFRRMSVVKELSEAGDNYRTIGQKMGISDYWVKLTIPRTKAFSFKELDALLADAADFNLKINSGLLNEKMAIELIMMKYAGA